MPRQPAFTPTSKASRRGDTVQRLATLRRAAWIALVAWPLFAALDWFIVEYIEPGRLSFLLGLRVLGLVLVGMAVGALHLLRRPRSSTLIGIETFICTSLAAMVSAQSLEFRGITSPLALGVVTILLFRGVMLSDHLRRSAIPVLATALAYPAVILALSQRSALIHAQLSDTKLVAMFLLNNAFIAAAAVLTLLGGHALWKVRRQVSQSRALGRYRLKELIGRGGMGEIWSAYHAGLRRDVAIKILRPGADDDAAVARFEREAHATAELSHPNTVRVYDYGVTEDGLWYYAMELLQGEDLGALLERGPVAPMRAADLICQASRALAEAHRRGIVHRDIKPANLFLCPLGGDADFVKVLDFGLAKLAEGDGHSQLTQAGMAVGTPSYVSPEVVMGLAADARADVYALGAVLYALCAGTPPFHGKDMRAVLLAHLHDQPELPSARLGRPLPHALEAVIMRCLAKEPGDRYADAAALGEALAAIVRDPGRLSRSEPDEPRRHRRLRAPDAEDSHVPRPPERHVPRPSTHPAPAYASHPPTYISRREWDDWADEAPFDERPTTYRE